MDLCEFKVSLFNVEFLDSQSYIYNKDTAPRERGGKEGEGREGKVKGKIKHNPEVAEVL